MPVTISHDLFPQLSELIAARMGLQFSPARWSDLERGIASAAQEFRAEDPDCFIHRLLGAPLTKSQIEILASHLTVGETYFFREERTFHHLETRILPELINARRAAERRLRIWSAGCATGEEPYSVAILLHKLIPDLERWNVTILATDINPSFLEKGVEGIYRDWSFRNTPPWVPARYFEIAKGGGLQVRSSIRKMVNFSYLNLAEDVYPSLWNDTNGMDVILCRNVLMYFAAERAAGVIRSMHRSLTDGGWLIVSPCELSPTLFSEFQMVHFPGAIFYQKSNRKPIAKGNFRAQGADDLQWFHPRPPFAAVPQPETDRPFKTDAAPTGSGEKREFDTADLFACEALYRQGRYCEAAQKLLSFLLQSQNKDDYAAMALLARVYGNLGQIDRALEWSEKALAANKLNSGCHYLRAIILQEQGEIVQAELSLQRTLYLEPRFVLAHFALGNLSRQQGKIKESEKHFANALLILEKHRSDEVLAESDGLTAGRLAEIIRSTSQKRTLS